MKFAGKAIGWGVTIAVIFAVKAGVVFLWTEGRVVASRYVHWDEADREAFIRSCGEGARKSTSKELGPETMAQPEIPLMVEVYASSYCGCMVGKVEASGAVTMKYNKWTTSREQAVVRMGAEIDAYTESEDGKKRIAECDALAVGEAEARVAEVRKASRNPSGR